MKRIILFSVFASLLVFTGCKKEVTVTVKSNKESWGKVLGGGKYARGTEVKLQANPTSSLYRFAKWEDGNTDNPRIITAKKDATYTAVFEYNSSGGGGIIPGGGGGTSGNCIDNLINNMVKVQGGSFLMGSPDSDIEAVNQEKPQHRVTLSDFYICKYEVTQELWTAVMGESSTVSTKWKESLGKGDTYPAYNISWNDCDTFIQRLNAMTNKNFRLPTEAEWEYAARGGNQSKGYLYSGSDTIGNVAWYYPDHKINIIMQKQPNELGLYDMSGNMAEWCSDWYDRQYYSNSQNSTNPQGPATGTERVLRGGRWHDAAAQCRVAYRLSISPTVRADSFGFRLAMSAE